MSYRNITKKYVDVSMAVSYLKPVFTTKDGEYELLGNVNIKKKQSIFNELQTEAPLAYTIRKVKNDGF